MAKAIELTVGGRKLRQILKSTVKHDIYLMDQIRRSGINEVVKRVDESAQEFAMRLLNQLVSTQALVPVLAGCFIDSEKEDLTWTPEESKQLATFFEELSEEEDKKVIFTMAVRLIADFFAQGVVPLRASLSSSVKLPKDAPLMSLNPSEEQSATESGR